MIRMLPLKHVYLKSTWVLLTIFLMLGCSIQPKRADNYEGVLTKNFAHDEAGVVVALYKKGQVHFQKAVGIANMDENIPLTQDMQFPIASMTKQFTAVAIMLLQERGQLSVKDNAAQYLKKYNGNWQNITIEHLLTHSSGISDYLNHDLVKWSDKLSLTEVIDSFKQLPLRFEPGSKTSYSNSGYVLLGAIIEQVSGISYTDFIQQEIFDKLKMHNSYVCQCNSNNIGNLVGHNGNSVSSVNISGPIALADGAIVSNTEDLGIWSTAIIENRLLTKASWDSIFTSYILNNQKPTKYGFGWRIYGVKGDPVYEHGGNKPGFKSNIIIFPAKGVSLIMLSNRRDRSFSSKYNIGFSFPWSESKYTLFGLDHNNKLWKIRNMLLNMTFKKD